MSFNYSSQTNKGFTELQNERGKKYKIFKSGNTYRVIACCRNIHYKPVDSSELTDIDINLHLSGNKYITDDNTFSVAFRTDNSSNRYIDISRGDNSYSISPYYLEVNEEEVSISETFASGELVDNNKFIHYINENTYIEDEINMHSIHTYLHSNEWIYSFEFIKELDITNFTILNNYNISGAYTYYIKNNKGSYYIKCNDSNEDIIEFHSPYIKSSSNICTNGINHLLYESGGRYFYRKILNDDGETFILSESPPYKIDLSATYSSQVNDGYVYYAETEFSPVWDSTHDSASGFSASDVDITLSTAIKVTTIYDSKASSYNVQITRTFLPFSTSALPDNAIISDAVLTVTGYTNNDSGVYVVSSNANFPLTTADFDACVFSGNGITADGAYASAMSWALGENEMTLNQAGRNHIKLDGVTKFALLEQYDFWDVYPGDNLSYSNGMYYANASSSYPTLEITYTLPSVWAPDTYIDTSSYGLERYILNDGWLI